MTKEQVIALSRLSHTSFAVLFFLPFCRVNSLMSEFITQIGLLWDCRSSFQRAEQIFFFSNAVEMTACSYSDLF